MATVQKILFNNLKYYSMFEDMSQDEVIDLLQKCIDEVCTMMSNNGIITDIGC